MIMCNLNINIDQIMYSWYSSTLAPLCHIVFDSQSLASPPLTPPNYVFPFAWTAIYACKYRVVAHCSYRIMRRKSQEADVRLV